MKKHNLINELKGNRAYVLKGGRYVLAETNKEMKKAEYLTAIQVSRINNLLIAKLYIDKEIDLIKCGKDKHEEITEPIDELIAKSELSIRAKNVFENMEFKMLTDIAKHPVSKWNNWRNMGTNTIKETKEYLNKKGFIVNEK
jgi:hypothetical protein